MNLQKKPGEAPRRKYPYLNLELIDLPNEKWKAIPGQEGYYDISSFGRVRRKEFEIVCSNGQVRWMRPKIMSSDITVVANHTVGDKLFFLRVKITREGITYNVSIARVVYYCFIRKFDLDDQNLIVFAKDGDGKNIQPDNLALVDISRKQKRIFERNRLKKTFVYSYDEFNQGLEKSANNNCIQISQYDLKGKRIRTYPSANAAGQALGIRPSLINAVLKERQVSTGGFIWRYGKDAKTDIHSFVEKRKKHFKVLVGQKVSQYAVDGKRVATYLTIADAARATDINPSDLWSAVSGVQRSAGGFIWKKGWGKKKIDLSNYSLGVTYRAEKQRKRVKQYSLNGKYIQTFPSFKAAAEAIAVKSSAISIALKRKSKQCGGFKWKLA